MGVDESENWICVNIWVFNFTPQLLRSSILGLYESQDPWLHFWKVLSANSISFGRGGDLFGKVSGEFLEIPALYFQRNVNDPHSSGETLAKSEVVSEAQLLKTVNPSFMKFTSFKEDKNACVLMFKWSL